MGIALGAVGAIGAAFALVGVVQSINEATRSTLEFNKASKSLSIAQTFDQSAVAASRMAQSQAGVFDKLWDWLANVNRSGRDMNVTLGGIPTQIDDIGRVLSKLSQTGDLTQLANYLEIVRKGAHGNKAEMAALNDVLDKYQGSVSAAAAQTRGHASLLDSAATASTKAAQALELYTNDLKAQSDPFFAVMNAQKQNTEAQKTYADAVAKVTFLQKAGQTGTQEYRDALVAQQDATVGAGQSGVNLMGALTTLAGKVANNKDLAEQFKESLFKMASTGVISADAASKLAGTLDTTAGSALNAAGGIAGVRDTAKTVPTSIHTTITADGGQAEGVINTLKGGFANLVALSQTRGVLTNATMTQVKGEVHVLTTGKNSTLARATGGSVLAGHAYLVGERGPELVVPGSGYVIPNRDLVKAMSNASGGTTVNVNVTAGVGDPAAIGRTVVDALKAYERTAGTSWRN
jgi:hypothetical protein